MKSPVEKRMREGMRELVGELREKLIAEVREGMRIISEEIRKATGDQKRRKWNESRKSGELEKRNGEKNLKRE